MRETPSVLFVDDDESLLKALHLRYSGAYSVMTATTPEDALEIAREREDEIDVIVVDRWMASRGTATVDEDAGLKVIYGIKGVDDSPGIAPHVPVIVLTGHADNQSHFDTLKAGAFTYIVKGTTAWEQDLDEQIRSAGTISINLRMGKLARRLLSVRGTKGSAEASAHAPAQTAGGAPADLVTMIETIILTAEQALAEAKKLRPHQPA